MIDLNKNGSDESWSDDGYEISDAQREAIDELLAGKSVAESAASVGVSRSTVHRWFKNDHFKAAHNRGKKELEKNAMAKLMKLADGAADCVGQAVEDGDPKTALALLKGLGLLSGAPYKVGSSNPETVAGENQRHEQAAVFIEGFLN